MEKKVAATNRKAYHHYQILETFEAGIMLAGYEVKSLRDGDASLGDGFVRIVRDEAWLENVHIAPYKQQSTHIIDFDSRRKRKLLMHKQEIIRLFTKMREKGLTLVPLELYFSARGMVKVSLGLAKGKTGVDKRETLKKKDLKRELDRWGT